MTGKKLKVDKVWSHMQGGGQEYLTLVYENCYGAGLAYNQMQFIADEINNGRIVLPAPATECRNSHIVELLFDVTRLRKTT